VAATPAPPVDRAELLQDAVSALQETQNALAALDNKDGKAATAALERATGKLEIVLARNPSLALAPVDVSVISYDVLGSVDAVKALRKSAEERSKMDGCRRRAISSTGWRAKPLFGPVISRSRPTRTRSRPPRLSSPKASWTQQRRRSKLRSARS
jgi:hypothetical protein